MKNESSRTSVIQRTASFLIRQLIRQIIATAIFVAVIYAMHSSNNFDLNSYAVSLGRALRYDYNIEERIQSGSDWLKEKFSPDSFRETEGITFQ